MNAPAPGRGRARPLTDDDKALILELAEEGMKPGPISRRLGRSAATVYWHMIIEGLIAPAPSPEKAGKCVRGGRTIYRYSSLEDAFIEALRIQGFDCNKIAELAAKRFGTERNHHSIRCRLKMLAAREVAA